MTVEQEHQADQNEFDVNKILGLANRLVGDVGLKKADVRYAGTDFGFDDCLTAEVYVRKTLENADHSFDPDILDLAIKAAEIAVRNEGYGELGEICNYFDFDFKELVCASHKPEGIEKDPESERQFKQRRDEEYERQFNQLRECSSEEARSFLEFDRGLIKSEPALQGEPRSKTLADLVWVVKELRAFRKALKHTSKDLTFETFYRDFIVKINEIGLGQGDCLTEVAKDMLSYGVKVASEIGKPEIESEAVEAEAGGSALGQPEALVKDPTRKPRTKKAVRPSVVTPTQESLPETSKPRVRRPRKPAAETILIKLTADEFVAKVIVEAVKNLEELGFGLVDDFDSPLGESDKFSPKEIEKLNIEEFKSSKEDGFVNIGIDHLTRIAIVEFEFAHLRARGIQALEVYLARNGFPSLSDLCSKDAADLISSFDHLVDGDPGGAQDFLAKNTLLIRRMPTRLELGRYAESIKLLVEKVGAYGEDTPRFCKFEDVEEAARNICVVSISDGDRLKSARDQLIDVAGRVANEVINPSTVAETVSAPVVVEETKTQALEFKNRKRLRRPSNKFFVRSAGAIVLAGVTIVGFKLRPDGFSIPNPLERQDQTNTITLNLHEVVVPTIKPIIVPYARERLIDRINKVTDDNQQLRERHESDQEIIERLRDEKKDLKQENKELEEDNRELQSELNDLQKQPTPDDVKPSEQPPEVMPVITNYDFSRAIQAFIADNSKLQERNIDLVYEGESFVVGPKLRQWMVEQGIRAEIADKINVVEIGPGEGLTQALERTIKETFAAQGEGGQGATNNPGTAESGDQAPLSFELEQASQHSDSWGVSVANQDFAPQAEAVKAVDVSLAVERSERTISGETADNGAAFLDQNGAKVDVAVAQEVAVKPNAQSNKTVLTDGQVKFRAKEIVDQIFAPEVSEIRDQAARDAFDLDQKAEDERQMKVAGDRAEILGTIGQELADSNQDWYTLLDEPLWVPNVAKYDDEDEDDEEEDFVYFSVIDRFKKQLTRLDRPFSRLFASHRLITSKKLRLEKYLSNREGISG